LVFQEGELIVFVDRHGRYYLQRLQRDGRFHSHRGYIDHDQVIGSPPGSRAVSSIGEEFFVFYPTLMDYTMNMPRKSGIIYPKDTGVILMWADLFPGSRVLLGGVGTGALLLAVVRQVGQAGRVVAYDVRQDMLDYAAQNLRNYLGETPNLTLKLGSVYEPIEEKGFDRILLDVPEPWQAIDTLYNSLLSGGIACAYVPSITQVDAFVNALKQTAAFILIETLEVLLRDWYLSGRSVRPNHRMVGHTGFLVFARKIERSPATEKTAVVLGKSPASPGEG